jgi:hypothetical protein
MSATNDLVPVSETRHLNLDVKIIETIKTVDINNILYYRTEDVFKAMNLKTYSVTEALSRKEESQVISVKKEPTPFIETPVKYLWCSINYREHFISMNSNFSVPIAITGKLCFIKLYNTKDEHVKLVLAFKKNEKMYLFVNRWYTRNLDVILEAISENLGEEITFSIGKTYFNITNQYGEDRYEIDWTKSSDTKKIEELYKRISKDFKKGVLKEYSVKYQGDREYESDCLVD